MKDLNISLSIVTKQKDIATTCLITFQTETDANAEECFTMFNKILNENLERAECHCIQNTCGILEATVKQVSELLHTVGVTRWPHVLNEVYYDQSEHVSH